MLIAKLRSAAAVTSQATMLSESITFRDTRTGETRDKPLILIVGCSVCYLSFHYDLAAYRVNA